MLENSGKFYFNGKCLKREDVAKLSSVSLPSHSAHSLKKRMNVARVNGGKIMFYRFWFLIRFDRLNGSKYLWFDQMIRTLLWQ